MASEKKVGGPGTYKPGSSSTNSNVTRDTGTAQTASGNESKKIGGPGTYKASMKSGSSVNSFSALSERDKREYAATMQTAARADAPLGKTKVNGSSVGPTVTGSGSDIMLTLGSGTKLNATKMAGDTAQSLVPSITAEWNSITPDGKPVGMEKQQVEESQVWFRNAESWLNQTGDWLSYEKSRLDSLGSNVTAADVDNYNAVLEDYQKKYSQYEKVFKNYQTVWNSDNYQAILRKEAEDRYVAEMQAQANAALTNGKADSKVPTIEERAAQLGIPVVNGPKNTTVIQQLEGVKLTPEKGQNERTAVENFYASIAALQQKRIAEGFSGEITDEELQLFWSNPADLKAQLGVSAAQTTVPSAQEQYDQAQAAALDNLQPVEVQLKAKMDDAQKAMNAATLAASEALSNAASVEEQYLADMDKQAAVDAYKAAKAEYEAYTAEQRQKMVEKYMPATTEAYDDRIEQLWAEYDNVGIQLDAEGGYEGSQTVYSSADQKQKDDILAEIQKLEQERKSFYGIDYDSRLKRLGVTGDVSTNVGYSIAGSLVNDAALAIGSIEESTQQYLNTYYDPDTKSWVSLSKGDKGYIEPNVENAAAATRLAEVCFAKAEQATQDAKTLLADNPLLSTAYDLGTNAATMAFDAVVGLGMATLTGGASAGMEAFNAARGFWGLASMATRVVGQSGYEAQKAGANYSQALGYGIASAGVEVMTERMFDAFAGIYGAGEADELVTRVIESVTDNPLLRMGLEFLVQGAGEGIEEVVSDLFSPLNEYITYNKDVLKSNPYNAEEMAYSFITGALLGLMGMGGQAAMSIASTGTLTGQYTGGIDTSGMSAAMAQQVSRTASQQLREQAADAADSETAFTGKDRLGKLAAKYGKKGSDTILSNQQAYRLMLGLQQADAATISTVAAEQLKANGFTGTDADAVARAIAQTMLESNTANAEGTRYLEAYANDPAVQQTMYDLSGFGRKTSERTGKYTLNAVLDNYRNVPSMDEIKSGKYSFNAETGTYSRAQAFDMQRAAGTGFRAAQQYVAPGSTTGTYVAGQDVLGQRTLASQQADSIVRNKAQSFEKDGKKYTLTNLTNKGTFLLKAEDGSSLEVRPDSEVLKDDPGLVALGSELKRLGSNAAEAYVHYEAGQNVHAYTTQLTNAINIASGMSSYQTFAGLNIFDQLTQAQKDFAWKAGQQQRLERMKAEAEQSKANAETVKGAPKNVRRQFDTSLTASRNVSFEGGMGMQAVDVSKLSKTQKQFAHFVKALSTVCYGINFHMGMSETNTFGAHVGNDIYINLNSGELALDVNTAIYTLSHELTHEIEQINPEAYRRLSDRILEILFKDDARGLEAAIETQKNMLSKGTYDGKTWSELSPEEQHRRAQAEVVANACAKMLKNSAFATRLAAEDRTVAGWVKKTLNSIFTRLSKVLYSQGVPTDKAKRAQMQQAWFGMDLLTEYEDVQQMWDDAMYDAAKVRNAQLSAAKFGKLDGTNSKVTLDTLSEARGATEAAALDINQGMTGYMSYVRGLIRNGVDVKAAAEIARNQQLRDAFTALTGRDLAGLSKTAAGKAIRATKYDDVAYMDALLDRITGPAIDAGYSDLRTMSKVTDNILDTVEDAKTAAELVSDTYNLQNQEWDDGELSNPDGQTYKDIGVKLFKYDEGNRPPDLTPVKTVYRVWDKDGSYHEVEDVTIKFAGDRPKGYVPKKIGKAYKVLEQWPDKSIHPLFAGTDKAITVGPGAEWMWGMGYPSEGMVKTMNLRARYAWHLGTLLPTAVHLMGVGDTMNPQAGYYSKGAPHPAGSKRVWVEVEYDATNDYNGLVDSLGSSDGDVLGLSPFGGYYVYKEQNMSEWVLSSGVRFTKVLSEEERQQILKDAGYDETAEWQKKTLNKLIGGQQSGTFKAVYGEEAAKVFKKIRDLQKDLAQDTLSLKQRTSKEKQLAKLTDSLELLKAEGEPRMQAADPKKYAAAKAKLERYNEILDANPYKGYVERKFTDEEGIAHLNEIRESVKSRITDNTQAQAQFQQWDDAHKDTLIAMHSVYEDKLLPALRMGGLPSPSIAVVKQAKGTQTDYGPISLVFYKAAIDPEANRANRLYGADAYTPTIGNAPTANRFNEDVFNSFADEVDRLNQGLKKLGYMSESSGVMLSRASLDYGRTSKYGTDAAMVDAFKNMPYVMAAFLNDKGYSFEPAYQSVYTEEQIALSNRIIDQMKDVMEKVGDDPYYELSSEDKDRLAAIHKEDYYEKLIKKGTDAAKAERFSISLAEHYREKIEYGYEAAREISTAVGIYDEGGVSSAQELDVGNTNEAIRQETRKHQDEYEQWLSEKLKGTVGELGIVKKGKEEGYTRSGKRYSFDQMYDRATPEKIVAAMNKAGSRGIGANGQSAAGIQSVTAPEYKSLAEAKKDSGRLQTLSKEEYEAALAAVNRQITGLANVLSLDGMYAYDFSEAIIEAARGTRSTVSIKNAFKKYGINLLESQAKTVQQIYKDAALLPTDYFEAKPQRVVGFDEVAAAVIPSLSSAELKAELAKNGIRTIEYDINSNESRLDALNSIEDQDVQFQLWNNPNAQVGINVRDSKTEPFTDWILDGSKTIETRNTNSLRPYVGKTVGMVMTGRGKATVKGYFKIGEPVIYHNEQEFRADYDKHRVAPGSKYDIKPGGVKYGYPLTEVRAEANPYTVSEKGIIARDIDPNIQLQQRNVDSNGTERVDYTQRGEENETDNNRERRRLEGYNSGRRSSESIQGGRVSERRSSEDGRNQRGSRKTYDTDSEGRGIRPEVRERLNEKTLRDSNGNPVAAYHYSPNEFTNFERGDIGFHFGNMSQALRRKNQKGTNKGRIIRTFLNIGNPVMARLDIMNWKANAFAMYCFSEGIISKAEYDEIKVLVNQGLEYSSPAAVRLREMLEAKGYDGLAYPNGFEGDGMSYAAFHNSQIIQDEILDADGNSTGNYVSYSNENDVQAVDANAAGTETQMQQWAEADELAQKQDVEALAKLEKELRQQGSYDPELVREIHQRDKQLETLHKQVVKLQNDITKARKNGRYFKQAEASRIAHRFINYYYSQLSAEEKAAAIAAVQELGDYFVRSTVLDFDKTEELANKAAAIITDGISYFGKGTDGVTKVVTDYRSQTIEQISAEITDAVLEYQTDYSNETGYSFDRKATETNADRLRSEKKKYDYAWDRIGELQEQLKQARKEHRQLVDQLESAELGLDRSSRQNRNLRETLASERADFKAQLDSAVKQQVDILNEMNKLIRNKDRYEEQLVHKLDVKMNELERVRKARDAKYAKLEAKRTQQVSDLKARYNERDLKRTYKDRVGKLMADLNRKLQHPTERNHVPQSMIKQTVEVLNSINQDSGRSERLREKLLDIKAQYEALANSEDIEAAACYDEVVTAALDSMVKAVGDTPIAKMTSAQLEKVFDALTVMNHVITEAVKVEIGEKEYAAYQVSTKMIGETRSIDKAKANVGSKWLNASLSPERMFNRLGNYSKDSMWGQVYRMLDEGQLKMTRIMMESTRMFEGLMNDRRYADLTSVKPADLVDVGLVDENGNAILITKGMLLSLCMHLQNEDNSKHLARGGLTLPDLKEYYRHQGDRGFGTGRVRAAGISKELSEAGHAVSEAEKALAEAHENNQVELYDDLEAKVEEAKQAREEIIAKGDEYVMKLMRKAKQLINSDSYLSSWIKQLQEYYDVYSKNTLNEATEKVYGIKKAGVEHYFPISTDSNFLQAPFESIVRDMSLENVGFMKERNYGANPMYLFDVTDVLSRSIRNTARYAGMMPAIRNFNKVFQKTQTGWSDSLKNAITDKFGKDGIKYIDNLMQDLNGAKAQDSGTLGALLSAVRGNMAQANLTLSVRTALSQTASYPTAAAVVGWKALNKALMKGGKDGHIISRADQELIAKYSPLLWFRMQGYSTVELGDLEANKAQNVLWRKMRWMTGWIQAMDGATVGRLWYAAEYAVQERQPGLKKGSDEYYQEVAKLFNEVVEKTQPNYTTLQRPDILRNKNELVKNLTMFLTQRLQNFNILYDACATYSKYKGDYKKGLNGVTAEDVAKAALDTRRAVTSQLAAAATITCFKFLADVLLHSMKNYRDDEDGELDWFGGAMNMELLDMFMSSLAGNFLWGTEAYEFGVQHLIEGKNYYGIEVSSISTVTDMIDAFDKLANAVAADKTKEGYSDAVKKQTAALVKKLAVMGGIPVGNAQKIIEGLLNHVKDAANGEFFSFEAGYEYTTAQNTRRLYDAVMAGDEEKAGKVKELFKTEDEAESKLVSYIANKYVNDKTLDRDQVVELLVSECGYTQKEAEKKALQLTCELDTGIKYSNIRQAYLDGKITEEQANDMLKKYGGKTEDEAAETVTRYNAEKDTGISYSEAPEAYVNGRMTDAQAEKYLITYGDYTAAEAKEKVLQWKCEKDLGYSYSDVKKLFLSGKITENTVTGVLVKYGGKTREQAAETLTGYKCEKACGYSLNNLKEAVQTGKLNAVKAQTMRVRYAGDTAAEARAKVAWWQYEAANPGTKLNESSYTKYSTTVASTGISAKAYEKIRTTVDADGNGGISMKEAAACLKPMVRSGEITVAQANAMWKSFNKGWKKTFSSYTGIK